MFTIEIVDITPEVARILDDQDGLITRQQALAEGLSKAAIRHALGPGGRWQLLVPGVYSTFSGPLQERHLLRGALLYAGAEAIVTGARACRAFGMTYVPQSTGVVLLVPAHVRRAPMPIATIHRVRAMPTSRTLRGIPCAPPERAAIDAIRGDVSLGDTRATLCEVVQRGLCTTDMLLAEFEVVDRRGLGLARQVMDDVRAGCRSAPECELRDAIARHATLPEPLWNTALAEAPDLIPDGQYPEARLALEMDSMEWHQIGDTPERTERKRARYASIGWGVLSVSPRRLRAEEAIVVAEIESARTHGLRKAA